MALCAATKASTSTDAHILVQRNSCVRWRARALELVTGEAVALDIRVARLASRALALFIDMLLQILVLYFCLSS